MMLLPCDDSLKLRVIATSLLALVAVSGCIKAAPKTSTTKADVGSSGAGGSQTLARILDQQLDQLAAAGDPTAAADFIAGGSTGLKLTNASAGTGDLTLNDLSALAAFFAGANSVDPIAKLTVASLLDDAVLARLEALTKTQPGASNPSLRLNDATGSASDQAPANGAGSTGQAETMLATVKAAASAVKSQQPEAASAIASSPDQAACLIEGALLNEGSCQCRGWGHFVDGYTFPGTGGSPSTAGAIKQLANSGALAPGKFRRCPNLEQRYCHGWPTDDGSCGIFGKGATWQSVALANRAPEGESTCSEQTYRAALQADDSVRNRCGTQYGLLIPATDHIQIWVYNHDGNSGTPATIASNPNVGMIYTLGATLNGDTSKVVQACNSLINGTVKAQWTESPAQGCVCGTRTMELNEILNMASMAAFNTACLATMQ